MLVLVLVLVVVREGNLELFRSLSSCWQDGSQRVLLIVEVFLGLLFDVDDLFPADAPVTFDSDMKRVVIVVISMNNVLVAYGKVFARDVWDAALVRALLLRLFDDRAKDLVEAFED